MIRASTFRPPARIRAERPIPTSFDVDERIQAESRRVHHVTGAHAPAYPYERRRLLNAASLLIGDMAALSIAILLGIAARSLLWDLTPIPIWLPLFLGTWAVAAGTAHLYPGWGLGPVDEMRGIVRSTLMAGSVVAVALVLMQASVLSSRFVLVATVLAALPLVPLTRSLVRYLLRTSGRWGVDVAVYGTERSALRIVHLLADQPQIGLHPVGIFSDDPSCWGHDLDGVRVVGDTRLVHPQAPIAVLAVDGGDARRSLLQGPLRYYRRVLFIPDAADQASLVTRAVDLGGLLALELRVNLASPVAQFIKRTTDLALVALSSPLWGLLAAAGALCVWLEDRSNPFFTQVRTGRAGHEIRVLKLRTMVPDAEQVLERALDADPALRAEWQATCKLKDDPRVTRVGRIIRRLSIDELPQLVNVLRGDMALIGPRPLPEYHEERLSEDARYLRRHVRPGVSGLWQVSGRSDTGDDAMGWLDAYYVRNWSLWLDVAIIIRTLRAAVAGSGAY